MSLTMTDDQMHELESKMNEEMEELLRQQRATICQQIEAAVEAITYEVEDGNSGPGEGGALVVGVADLSRALDEIFGKPMAAPADACTVAGLVTHQHPRPDPLATVRDALTAYHRALDRHEHGGVAAAAALDAIEEALGTPYRQGATLATS